MLYTFNVHTETDSGGSTGGVGGVKGVNLPKIRKIYIKNQWFYELRKKFFIFKVWGKVYNLYFYSYKKLVVLDLN
jgi:hypothetical protein